MDWQFYFIKSIFKSLSALQEINSPKWTGRPARIQREAGRTFRKSCRRPQRRISVDVGITLDNLFFIRPLIFENNNRSCNGRAQRQWGATCFLLALLIFLSPFTSNSYDAGIFSGADVVLEKRSVLRAGPEKDQKVIESLGRGTVVRILAAHNDWLKIQYKDRTGYIENHLKYFQKPPKKNHALDRARQNALEIKKKLDIATSEIESIAATEADVFNQLNNTEQLLNQIRREAAVARSELAKIMTEIDTHIALLHDLEGKIKKREDYLSNRLVALYKLSWLGELPVLASAESSIDFFKRKSGLEFILDYDQAELGQLRKEKQTHAQVVSRLELRQTEKKIIETKLTRKKEKLSIQLDKKSRLLSQIKKRKKLQVAAVSELKRAAEKLEQTITSLSEANAEFLPESRYEERDFSRFKGLLNLPVKGKIIYFYGRYKDKRYNVVNFRTGITIQADRGEPIRSVGNGVTIFADWFRGYGNMIIIDHGNHYYTVYAYLEDLFKSKGDLVETDEVIATVGDTGSMGGTGLHFEVRHYGKPLDPMEWILKRLKRSQLNE